MSGLDWWFELKTGWGIAMAALRAPREAAAQNADAAEGLTTLSTDQNCALLHLRLEEEGIEPSELERRLPDELRRLAHVCSFCQDKAACERDILREYGGEAVHWQHYCPNAPAIRELLPTEPSQPA